MNPIAQNQDFDNRRETERVSTHVAISFKPKKKIYVQAFVHNVSERGLFMETQERLFNGTELLIYLPLEMGKKKKLCMVTGSVVRVEEPGEQGPKSYAVQFESKMSRMTRELLESYIKFKLGRPGIKRTPKSAPASNNIPKTIKTSSKATSQKKGFSVLSPGQAPDYLQDLEIESVATVEGMARKSTITVKRTRPPIRFSDRAFQIGLLMGVVVLLAVPALIFLHYLNRTDATENLSLVIPIFKTQVSDGIVQGSIVATWLTETQPERRGPGYQAFSKQLFKEGLQKAILSDSRGKKVVEIKASPSGDGNKIRVFR